MIGARPALLLARLDQRRARTWRTKLGHSALRAESGGPLQPARDPELRAGVQPGPHSHSVRPLQLVHQVPRPAGATPTPSTARYIATGHYAIARDGAPVSRRRSAQGPELLPVGIDRAVVARMLTPVGGSPSWKPARIAREASGSRTADKPESVEICFVPDDDYVVGPGAPSRRKRPRPESGTAGQHQRRGAGRASAASPDSPSGSGRDCPAAARSPGTWWRYPSWRPARSVVGSADELLGHTVELSELNWLSEPVPVGESCQVQLRYRSRAVTGDRDRRARMTESDSCLRDSHSGDHAGTVRSPVFPEGRVLGGGDRLRPRSLLR